MSEPAPRSPAEMRREYGARRFEREDLAPTWHEQLGLWLDEADGAGVPEPNAMVLATVDARGRPSTRTVLLKGLGPDGIVFYTNYDSRKGRDLSRNPWCSVTFAWVAIARQVTLIGQARRVPAEQSDEYFASRPRGAQIGAIASPQSEIVKTRAELDEHWAQLDARYPEGSAVPRPDHWGGFLAWPERVEFWQGRQDRLHDRLRYSRTCDGGWITERVAP